jgi:aryl-alcohol dehydrogenase-like predicted oxidoreductase
MKIDKRYWHVLNQYVNPLGMGCWQISGNHNIHNKPNGWGKFDKNEAINLIEHAIDNGIQFFDTANSYGMGKSEKIIGEVIKNKKNDSNNIIICSKIELESEETKYLANNLKFEIKVNQTLKRLNRDYLDILLFHNPPDYLNLKKFDTIILEKLINQGKIRSYGISHSTIKGCLNSLESNFGSCIEWTFNFLERRPIKDIFTELDSKKMNFIARSPLIRGLASEKSFTSNPIFDKNEFRSLLPNEWVEWVLSQLRSLNITDNQKKTISELAINYCLEFKEVSAVIPGINSVYKLNQILTYLKNTSEIKQFQSLVQKLPISYPKW